jgi:hypothetical protein
MGPGSKRRLTPPFGHPSPRKGAWRRAWDEKLCLLGPSPAALCWSRVPAQRVAAEGRGEVRICDYASLKVDGRSQPRVRFLDLTTVFQFLSQAARIMEESSRLTSPAAAIP